MSTEIKTQFTPEMDEFLRNNAGEHTYTQMRAELHTRFGKLIPVSTISEHCRKRLGVSNKPASFCPKNKTYHSCKPIGAERIEHGRSIKVKIAHPDVWKPKTEIVLGEIPASKQVIFLDGNPLNVVVENMIVVDKRIHARLAKNGWLNKDREIILTAIKWAELLYVIQEINKKG